MFLICFFLKNVVMWDAMYVNNNSLSLKENKEIKNVIIKAVKDMNLSYYNADKNELYNEEKAESIIQCDDIAMSGREKASYCRLSTFFMKNLKKEKDTYYFVFRLYYPKEYICNVEVKKINKLYKITSFTLDI